MSVFIGYPSFMAYQMMKGKKDNNDGFPSIPGMIARYSALGLTNEQMAANPVWADKTGNGNDLILSNFGFIEGSGYNEEGEYAGYLVTDGVDDKIISSNFKFGENYTVVGEWKFLQEASNVSAGFVKNPHYWILYNYKDGINAYIKADAQGSLISGVRSIKASTSKGDIYPDFNSYVKIEPGKRIESQYALNIAVNSSIFTKSLSKILLSIQQSSPKTTVSKPTTTSKP